MKRLRFNDLGEMKACLQSTFSETSRAPARVLVFSMSGRVRMMTCSFGRCSTHRGLANSTIR